MHKNTPKLTAKELDTLDKKTLRDLNLITKFYYDVIRSNDQRGIIKKVTPRQFYEFIKQNKDAPKQIKNVSTLK